MKPQLLKVFKGPAQSFNVQQDFASPYMGKWHYHIEVELMHIKTGSGKQFVGDHIGEFKDGDVLLIGPQLPHYFKFDNRYLEEDTLTGAEIRVAHFGSGFLGNEFLSLPENKLIRTVLEKSARGIKITGRAKVIVANLMERMLHAEGFGKMLLLLEALNAIAGSLQITPLSSIGYRRNTDAAEDERINIIYKYSLENFRNNIQLEDIAALVSISPSAFCRYFKSRTKKTYTQFLLEIKVGNACKLLIENKLMIKQICYDSGFNNFANFHKYFKQITGKNPLTFQREFMQLAS